MRNYYIRKVCDGTIKEDELANIYATSIDNVKKAVIDYKARRNPFRQADKQMRQGAIQVVISLFSIILVLLTLFEMQAERNAIYKPNISTKCPGIKFAWDDNHSITSDTSFLTEDVELRNWEREKDSYVLDDYVDMVIQNIGVGVARDVSVNWMYKKNYDALMGAISTIDDVPVTITAPIGYMTHLPYRVDFGVFISEEGQEQIITCHPNNESEYKYSFISPDLTNTETLSVPYDFIHVIKIICAYELWDNLPNLHFNVEFKDVQGEIYSKSFIIKPELEEAIQNPEGHGFATVSLNLVEEKFEIISFERRYGQIIKKCIIAVITMTCFIIASAILFELNRRKKQKTVKEVARSLESKCVDSDNRASTLKIDDINDKQQK